MTLAHFNGITPSDLNTAISYLNTWTKEAVDKLCKGKSNLSLVTKYAHLIAAAEAAYMKKHLTKLTCYTLSLCFLSDVTISILKE